MSRFRWILLLALVLLILAVKFLPWYVLVGLAVVFVVSLKFLGRWLLGWLFLMPFKAKGAVLHKAAAVVHSVEPAVAPPRPTPEPDEPEDGEAGDEDMAK